MKNIGYSVPAKVILSGEHAVVYGRPALVCAINKRANIFIKESLSDKKKFLEKEKKILKIVEDYLKKEKINSHNKNFLISVFSNIPIGRGLGSSASFSAGLISSFLYLLTGKEFEKEIINQLAYQAEKIFHKNPSGVDNTAVVFGGLIFYRKEFEFLKNISVLNIKIPKKIEERLFLIDSGKPKESTKEMVELVGDFFNKKPILIEEILFNIEKTTKRMVVSLVQGDENLFKKCLLDNQIYLEMLGVVSQKTKNLLKKLEEFGMGKITGAGGKKEGSGFIIFYAQKENSLINFLKKEKINYFKFIPDYQGLIKL